VHAFVHSAKKKKKIGSGDFEGCGEKSQSVEAGLAEEVQ
jgi:hypothetical protein